MNHKRMLLLTLLITISGWVGYQVGYHKASLDALALVTGTLATPPANNKKNTSVPVTSDDTTDSSAVGTVQVQQNKTTNTPQTPIQSLLPEDVALTLVDIIPQSQLLALMHQTTRIPINRLEQVADPRQLSKQLLVATDVLTPQATEPIMHSALGYSDLQVSAHINAQRLPVNGSLLVAGGRRLYFSFATPAAQETAPYYLLKIVAQGNPDIMVYFKAFTFTDDKRQFVWVERQWQAGTYATELFVLTDILERLQTVHFTIVPSTS